jgi:hypothetical protein
MGTRGKVERTKDFSVVWVMISWAASSGIRGPASVRSIEAE